MGLANIFRICGVLYILVMLVLVGVHLFVEWYDTNATDEHINVGKTMAMIIGASGIGTGILFLLASFIKDVKTSKMLLLGVTASSLLLLLSFVFNETVLDGSPPIPVWIIIGLTFVLSLYGRFRVNRI